MSTVGARYRLTVDNRVILGQNMKRGDEITIDNAQAAAFLTDQGVIEPVDGRAKPKEKAPGDGPPV